MSQSLAAFTPVKYNLTLIKLLYNETLYTKITNTKYEGQIKDSGDRVRVRTAAKVSLSAYTKGMTLVAQELNPVYEDLIIDQAQYFKFSVDDVDKVQNDIDAITSYAQESKGSISEMLDTDILSYMRKGVNSANMIGTAYATGTVAVAATTGVVTGTGTTWVAGHVGGIFTVAGLTGSYLVTARNSNTEIVIKDLDGVAYTGGAISAGATYSIAGAVAISLTKSNVYENIVALRTALSKSHAPMEGRFLVVNSAFEGVLLQAPEFIPAVGSAYEDAVKGGMVGQIGGFSVYRSELLDGDNTTGYWFVAGTKEYCSMALQILKTSVVPSEADPTTFTATCKGLVVWGRKIFAGTRAFGAVLRGKF
jgi:hypothetical protein